MFRRQSRAIKNMLLDLAEHVTKILGVAHIPCVIRGGFLPYISLSVLICKIGVAIANSLGHFKDESE